MQGQAVFVGGIHGAGKTQICKGLAQQLGIDHVTASELIRWSGSLPSNEHKQVESIKKIKIR